MISGGAAFTFALVTLIAGYALGYSMGVARRSHADETVGQEWGGIDAAATRAYYTISEEIASDPARRKTIAEAQEIIRRAAGRETLARVRRPWITLTCNGTEPDKVYILDAAGFRAAAGVTQEAVLSALGYDGMMSL